MPLEYFRSDAGMPMVESDIKSYSPNSFIEDNMSSPPCVLTPASTGGSTPSSLPSAGSTPSSLQSSGLTPYSLSNHEELNSKAVTPDRPMDHLPNTPITPGMMDQPITPDPSISSDAPVTPDQIVPRTPDTVIPQTPEQNNIGITNSCDWRSLPMSPLASDRTPNDHSLLGPPLSSTDKDSYVCTLFKDVKSRVVIEPLMPCNVNSSITCDMQNKSVSQISAASCVSVSDKVRGRGRGSHKRIRSSKHKGETKTASKSEVGHSSRQLKVQKVQYHSEIDPDSSSIKIKIMRSPVSVESKTVNSVISTGLLNSDSCASVNNALVRRPGNKCSKVRRSRKRKNFSDNSEVYPERGRKKRKSSPLEICKNYSYGPVLSEVNGVPQSPWGCRLPVKLLVKCLMFATWNDDCLPLLTRTASVCRLWREASMDPSLLHTVDLASLNISTYNQNEKLLLWLLENKLSHVGKLNLSGWTDGVTPLVLERLPFLSPCIQSLNLTDCSLLHGEQLDVLLRPFARLSQLYLTNILGSHKPSSRCAVGQQTLANLFAHLNVRLTHLSLAYNTLSCISSIIKSLADHCPNLEYLDMSSVSSVGRDFIHVSIEELQKGCRHMKVLRFTKSLVVLTPSSISEQMSSPGFPELEELSVATGGKASCGFNDSELERILKSSTKLRVLDVRGCMNITDSSLVHIRSLDLEYLFLSGGSNPKPYSDRLELVVMKWRHSLIELDLSWTTNSDAIDTALLTIAEEKDNKLQYLNLCGSPVTFEPVKKVLLNCLHLEKLNLASCRALPRGVKREYSYLELVTLRQNVSRGCFDEQPDNDAG